MGTNRIPLSTLTCHADQASYIHYSTQSVNPRASYATFSISQVNMFCELDSQLIVVSEDMVPQHSSMHEHTSFSFHPFRVSSSVKWGTSVCTSHWTSIRTETVQDIFQSLLEATRSLFSILFLTHSLIVNVRSSSHVTCSPTSHTIVHFSLCITFHNIPDTGVHSHGLPSVRTKRNWFYST